MLISGKNGHEIDAPARAYFKTLWFGKYLIYPFVHTIDLCETESPSFSASNDDILKPSTTICVDVSSFAHSRFHGSRVKTGYEITKTDAISPSPKMDRLYTTLEF